MMEASTEQTSPLFSAVSGSARQIFQLLRCINFASKAQVQITKDGLRFMVEESKVMQGFVFLEKFLFSAYTFAPNQDAEEMEQEAEVAPFQISLSALLETLQILGINEVKDKWSHGDGRYGSTSGFHARGAPQAFENRVLGMSGICRLSYPAEGDPLSVVLEESDMSTICELYTYEAEHVEDIPLQKDAIAQKIIMRANWLHDAINELSSTSPTRLTMVSSPTAPYFTLSSSGPLGSATIEFSNDPQLLETFQVPSRTVNTYKYSLIKNASRAMSMATKVSIRTDEQGVLSLQFMTEVEGGISFVDFRFVPFLSEECEGEEENEGEIAEHFDH